MMMSLAERYCMFYYMFDLKLVESDHLSIDVYLQFDGCCRNAAVISGVI